jgi:hypothetical protein
MIDPPGYEEASRTVGGRFTIADGETDYQTFMRSTDEPRAFAFAVGVIGGLGALGGSGNPPRIGNGISTPSPQTKLFPNLFPDEAAMPVLKRELFFDGNKWRAIGPTGTQITPKGTYNFVVQDSKVFISRKNPFTGIGGHVDIAGGRPVQFAGEIRFGRRSNTGNLFFWNNRSGHYQPNSRFSTQAPLPQNLFTPF